MEGSSVLYLQWCPCIRPLKYAEGLNHGIGLYFGYQLRTLDESYGHGNELFRSFVQMPKDACSPDFRKALRALAEDVDPAIVHCHNTPDTITCAAIMELGWETPVIHDTHDVLTIRPGISDPSGHIMGEERFANMFSAGNVYVTDGVRDVLHAKYPELGSKKQQIVFHNYVPMSFVPGDDELRPKLSAKDGRPHGVYEGNLFVTDPAKPKSQHRDLRDIFLAITSKGVHMHIYSQSNPRYIRPYIDMMPGNPFLHIEGYLPTPELIRVMTRYDFGLASCNASHPQAKVHLNTALPNKAIDYVAAGIPVVYEIDGHETLHRFVEREGIGVGLATVHDLPCVLGSSRFQEARDVVRERRRDFTVESQIGALVDFYKAVAEGFAPAGFSESDMPATFRKAMVE